MNLATITHKITLSTTDHNLVGDIKVRQADDETIVLDARILEHGLVKNFDGLKPFFCLMAREVTGQGVSEEPVVNFDSAKGTLKYTLSANAMQMIGKNEAYFSFRKDLSNGRWSEQFSTRSFYYTVEKSIYTQPFKDSNYWFTFKELYQKFMDYQESGIDNWEKFVEQNRDVLESIDPGGVLLSEVIRSRKPIESDNPYIDLPTRLDEQIGKNSDFREFESNLSFMTRVYNESNERGANVKWFGAKGDGLSDDTAAIQFALDTFNYAFLPKGNYKVSRIVLPSNSKLIGVSKMDSVIIGGDENLTTEIVAVPRSSAYTQIEELSIKGNSGKASGIRYTSDGTETTGNNRHRIKNLYISDVYIGVVVPHFLRGMTMDDVMVERADYNGFNIQCTDSLFNNLISAISKRDGFYISGSNNRISNIKAYYAGTSRTAGSGVKIETCSFTTFNNIELQENVLDNIQIRDCSSLIIQNLISDGAGCLFGQGMGVDLKYLDGEFGDVPICNIKVNNIRNCIIDAIVYNGRTTTAGAKWQARYGLASMAAGLDNGNTIRVNIRNDSTDSTFNRFGFRTNTATLDSYMERNSVYINSKIANSVDIYIK